eukprot:9592027-Lingulodinium_polyedra.AAC.1
MDDAMTFCSFLRQGHRGPVSQFAAPASGGVKGGSRGDEGPPEGAGRREGAPRREGWQSRPPEGDGWGAPEGEGLRAGTTPAA